MTTTSAALGSFSRLSRPATRHWTALLSTLVLVPLVGYVTFRPVLGDVARYALLPSVPSVLILYGLGIRAWRSSWTASVGWTLVCFWLLIAVCVPYLPLVDPNKPLVPLALPGTVKHGIYFLLGSDVRGRDMLARTLWGCQRVLVWGLTATACAYSVGVLLGLLGGYLGGWWDEIVSFCGNLVLSFPVMVLFILVLNLLGQSGFNIVIAVTCSAAPMIMRIVRGLTLDAKTRDYISAAQTRGEHALWIMFVELLPNIRGPLIIDACLRLGYTTVAITTLTFLGLGLQPPDPDWGLMIKEGATAALLWKYSYLVTIPALSVSSLILGFNMLADGLRELRG
jgi:peptide/nickel transport system permease protein